MRRIGTVTRADGEPTLVETDTGLIALSVSDSRVIVEWHAPQRGEFTANTARSLGYLFAPTHGSPAPAMSRGRSPLAFARSVIDVMAQRPGRSASRKGPGWDVRPDQGLYI